MASAADGIAASDDSEQSDRDEDAREHGRRNTGSRITDLHPTDALGNGGADRQHAAAFHGLYGVQNQVHQDLLDHMTIDHETRQRGAQQRFKPDQIGREQVIRENKNAIDDLIDVGRAEFGLVLLGKVEQLPDDLLNPPDTILHRHPVFFLPRG